MEVKLGSTSFQLVKQLLYELETRATEIIFILLDDNYIKQDDHFVLLDDNCIKQSDHFILLEGDYIQIMSILIDNEQ